MAGKNKLKKYIDKVFIRSTVLVTITVLGLLFFCGYVGLDSIAQDENVAVGVHIDGTDLSGMTFEQAQEKVNADSQSFLKNVQITLDYSGETAVLGAEDLGVSLNQKEILDKAYYYNKDENDTDEQRFNKTIELSRGMDFNTDIVIDENKLRLTVEQYAAKYDEAAVDATAAFNKDTGAFTYTQEKEGRKINTDALVSAITDKLERRDFSAIEVTSDIAYPQVKQSELKENTALIAGCETIADNNEDRDINIGTICKVIDGIEIKPGEIFSVNSVAGQRTEAKGYKAAPAIADGILVEQVGGGICQLAGTLYNAALKADMDIVERVRHTWSSDYLPIGQDSTLNWDDKDLKIKNTSDYSIFISAKFENQHVKVNLYGQPLEDGVAIKVQNEIVEELKPGKTEVRYTSGLPDGTVQTVRKPRTGYKVNVYRIYLKGGTETDRELVSSDVYPPLNKIILVGNKNTPDK